MSLIRGLVILIICKSINYITETRSHEIEDCFSQAFISKYGVIYSTAYLDV